MNKPVSVALLVVGIILLILGFNTSQAFASEVNEFLTGSPSSKAIWLFIGGTAASLIGLLGILRGTTKN